jgi:hypothetical protein
MIATMRVRVGSVAFLKAGAVGYGVGLDDDGHRVEWLGDWRPMADLEPGAWVEITAWQVLAVDGELRLELSRAAMAERAAFLASALHREPTA